MFLSSGPIWSYNLDSFVSVEFVFFSDGHRVSRYYRSHFKINSFHPLLGSGSTWLASQLAKSRWHRQASQVSGSQSRWWRPLSRWAPHSGDFGVFCFKDWVSSASDYDDNFRTVQQVVRGRNFKWQVQEGAQRKDWTILATFRHFLTKALNSSTMTWTHEMEDQHQNINVKCYYSHWHVKHVWNTWWTSIYNHPNISKHSTHFAGRPVTPWSSPCGTTWEAPLACALMSFLAPKILI